MPIACPACRKAIDDAVACPRCGCDVDVLHTIERARSAALARARAFLLAQQPAEALIHATTAWRLHHGPDAAKVACMASCSLHEFRDASMWHARVRGCEDAVA